MQLNEEQINQIHLEAQQANDIIMNYDSQYEIAYKNIIQLILL